MVPNLEKHDEQSSKYPSALFVETSRSLVESSVVQSLDIPVVLVGIPGVRRDQALV